MIRKLPLWALVGILVTFVISCSVSQKNCKKLLRTSYAKTFDMVIVPGFPFDTSGWDRNLKGRIYWAKFLFDRGIAKNIMFSGSAVYTPYVEADIMSLYAEAIGIPKEHIFTETKAEHTTENIYYSYKKAKKMGYKTIALASDPFQIKMRRRFALKKVSPEIALIPFVFDTLKIIEPEMRNPVIDFKKAYVKDFISLPERKSFCKRIKGTAGHNIDTSAYN